MSNELRRVPQICQSCGQVSPGGMALAPGASLTLKNITMLSACPYCGGQAVTTDGSYHWGDMLWEAVRQPGITKEAIETFRETAEAVQSGQRRADEAAQDLAEINSVFAKILQFANENEAAMMALISTLSLIIAVLAMVYSNQGSTQAHADALAQLQATEMQTKVSQSVAQALSNVGQAQQAIDDKIAELNSLGAIQQSTQQNQQTSQRQMPASSRQQRRRMEQLARKRARQAQVRTRLGLKKN